jgi:ABC-2 type transport system permease protein
MSGAIFKETLRRGWRTALYWSIGLAMLGAYIVIVIPNVDTLKEYTRLFESLPPALLKMFGAGDVTTLATPEGFVAYGFFGYTLLMLAVYAVLVGLNVTANEEDEGILDMMLSLPVARWRIVAEKLAAYTLLLVGIIIISFIGLLLGLRTSTLEIDMGKLLVSTVNILPGALLMVGFTAFVATVARRKSTAVALASLFIIGSYFVNFIGELASGTAASALRALSFFNYYDASGTMLHGLNLGNWLLLLVVALALFAGTVWGFNRRDVGV